MAGVFFPRTAVAPGLVVTFCALNTGMCASPLAASVMGGNILHVFLQNSADCLDMFASTMPVNNGVSNAGSGCD